MIKDNKLSITGILVNDSLYLKREDVVNLLIEYFSSEVADSRIRGFKLVHNISQLTIEKKD